MPIYRKWVSPLYYIMKHSSHHHRTQNTHPRQDIKMSGSDTSPHRQPIKLKMSEEDSLELTETSMSIHNREVSRTTTKPRLQSGTLNLLPSSFQSQFTW